MRVRIGGFHRWRARLGRREPPEHLDARDESAEPAEPHSATDEPLAALDVAIATHERLVRDLVAATAAEQAVLQELYQSASLDDRIGADALASTGPGDAGDASVEIRADLEARLFGPFEVRYRGKALTPWPSQRAASLLKFLLLHQGRPVRREVLMDAFWPSSSTKSARNNLNVTVYQLRGRLRAQDPDRTHIVYGAGSYRINPELSCRIDVDDYARSVARGHEAANSGDGLTALKCYREARTLYAGPLLDGDTSGDWYVERQRRYHFDHCSVLECLCALLLERGDVDEAITVGNELLEADPCRETAHQLLMRAYAALEQPHLILQQFRRCEATMRRELSVDLSETTLELSRALLPRR